MTDEKRPVNGANLSGSFDVSARRVVTVDVEKYRSFLDDSDVSEALKEEFLQAIWAIVVTFVELGFNVHPLQEVCGQNEESAILRAKDDFDRVESGEPDKTKEGGESALTGVLEVE